MGDVYCALIGLVRQFVVNYAAFWLAIMRRK